MKATVDADLNTSCRLYEDTCMGVFALGVEDVSEVLADDCAAWAGCAGEAAGEYPQGGDQQQRRLIARVEAVRGARHNPGLAFGG